ncbi:hypothetical protein [Salibacterium lacus]|uniref:Uncharacterized protein n=1 Tax=Salibacterium lacus TaxID=1898109 RepID=A0ABW5SW38_9BACI
MEIQDAIGQGLIKVVKITQNNKSCEKRCRKRGEYFIIAAERMYIEIIVQHEGAAVRNEK